MLGVGALWYDGLCCSALPDHPTMVTLEGDLKLIRELLEIEIPFVGEVNRPRLYRRGRSFNDLCRG
jgi:hypothetical protein